MIVLLAGGAGYIGSHTAVNLLEKGYQVIIVDNFINSSPSIIKRIETITGKPVQCYCIDIRDSNKLLNIFVNNRIDCVIHFAGLKAVGESIVKPIDYYRNNIDTTLSLLECMEKTGVNKLVFSSSATVYGERCLMPCIETMPRGCCTNPYGWTKVIIEQILEDVTKSNSKTSVIFLRYFNPVGAHVSGIIGEDIKGIPNNLMPYITQVAIGKRKKLIVFGGDYNTPDGTCLRDFIHVMDLANAHSKAIEYTIDHKGISIFNIGTGKPYSILDVINTFELVNNIKINYEIGPRRNGDLPEVWANVDKAAYELGWKAYFDLSDMCRDAWRWQRMNPKGY